MTNRKTSKIVINVGKQYLDVWIYEKSLHIQEENSAAQQRHFPSIIINPFYA